MIHIICAAVLSFFSCYPKQSSETITFLKNNADKIRAHTPHLSSNERAMALAIVAPEISQFSEVSDFVELRTLYVLYLNTGTSDFSTGLFQMKPSFVETLENYIKKSSALKKKYAALLPKGSQRACRRSRLDRLSSFEGQLEYLEVFIQIVKDKTDNLKFPNNTDRIKHWATLYNSGINLSLKQVKTLQNKKLFPRNSRKFNYSNTALEFYEKLRDYNW